MIEPSPPNATGAHVLPEVLYAKYCALVGVVPATAKVWIVVALPVLMDWKSHCVPDVFHVITCPFVGVPDFTLLVCNLETVIAPAAVIVASPE